MFFKGSFKAFRDNCKTLKKGVKISFEDGRKRFFSCRRNKLVLNGKDRRQYYADMEALRDQRSVIKTGRIEGKAEGKAGNLSTVNGFPFTDITIFFVKGGAYFD